MGESANTSDLDAKITPDAESAAIAAADILEAGILGAIGVRGKAAIAVSGGSTPWLMLGSLARRALPWHHVHIFQVDEREAPDGDADRNLTHLVDSLGVADLPTENLHAMDVSRGVEQAATIYEEELRQVCDGVLDVVHLGLGDDGHTASLAPGDPVCDVADHLVAATSAPFNGHRRVTLTYPAIEAARAVLWLVIGEAKQEVLFRLVNREGDFPAQRVSRERAVLVCDRAAGERLDPNW